ncbi:MAG TPA: hypothetical protein VF720_06745 [Candidatus Eisenbacteria bacterium]
MQRYHAIDYAELDASLAAGREVSVLRTSRRGGWWWALLVLGITACERSSPGDAQGPADPTVLPDPPNPVAPPDPIDPPSLRHPPSSLPARLLVTRQWSGSAGGHTDDGDGYRGLSYRSTFVLENDDSLRVFWEAAHPGSGPPPPRPMLDFNREVMLVTTHGWNTGCVAFSIDSLDVSPDRTVAFITSTRHSGRACILCEYSFSRIWTAAAIPKLPGPVEPRFTYIGVSCGGGP